MNSQPDQFDDDDDEFVDPTAPSQVDSLAESIGARNLKIIIITMPFVFMAALAVIIALFGGDKEDADTASALSAAEILASPETNAGALTGEAGVGAISLDGDRLAVRVDGPDGVKIIIYDVATGDVVQTITVSAD